MHDIASFEALVRANIDSLRGFLLAALRSEVEAEDLLQEALLVA
ncbi:MAG: hypothetical protein ABIP94_20175 [Planctomycetota bacterium]